VIGVALADFVERSGKMRLVCSPQLTEGDIAAIKKGLELRECIDRSLIRDIRDLVKSPVGNLGVELLATLLAAEVLDLRIAYRPDHAGISHSKTGIFESRDGSRIVSVGSANETAAAMLPSRNHESFAVFTSWGGEDDVERVRQVSNYFDSLWNGFESGICVREFPNVPHTELMLYRNPEGVEGTLNRTRQEMKTMGTIIRPAPAITPLMAHQNAVLASWEESGNRGIVKHATGSGKTLTAIEAIRRWIRPSLPAIVFVPSDILPEQWATVVRLELSDIPLDMLIVGGIRTSRGWERSLPDFTRNAAYLGPRLVIATMQSGSTNRFLENIVTGDHLLVVADEVHRIGSPNFRRILSLQSGACLGLSATPQRYGDREGTLEIFNYFGPILKPEFGIPDAILAGRIAPYDYYMHQVSLIEPEQEQWDESTRHIQTSCFCSFCLYRQRYFWSLASNALPSLTLTAISISLFGQPSKKVLASSQASRSIALSSAINSPSSIISPSLSVIGCERFSSLTASTASKGYPLGIYAFAPCYSCRSQVR